MAISMLDHIAEPFAVRIKLMETMRKEVKYLFIPSPFFSF